MSKQHVVLEENALKKKLKLHCQNFLLLLYYYKLNGQNQKEWAKLFQYFPFLLPLIGTNDIAWGNLYKIPVPYYYTRAQNVCPGWPVYEVKQPQEKWVCDFCDDAPPLSFQLQVAEVIF